MKKKVEKALARLSDSSIKFNVKWIYIDKKNVTAFEIGKRPKKIIGFAEIDGAVVTMYITETNYNRNYLKRKVRKAFLKEKINNVEFSFLQSKLVKGSIIYSQTRIRAEIGDHVSLKASFWINENYGNGALKCNPKQIGRKRKARYLGTEQKYCLPNNTKGNYSKLELL